jgi:coenzyme PQQ precursor peptide PqqA
MPCAGKSLETRESVAYGRYASLNNRLSKKGGMRMRTWNKPTIVEIAVGLEINSYACAE